MRKTRALIGLPVIVNNRRIGRVIQAELSADLEELSGLWIASGFLGTRFIAADRIGMIGEVSVMTDDSGIRRRCTVSSLFCRAVGTDGSRVGVITGAEIDEVSFRVEALELSCGVWEDLFVGRIRIRGFALNQETGNVVIDVSEMEKEVRKK